MKKIIFYKYTQKLKNKGKTSFKLTISTIKPDD